MRKWNFSAGPAAIPEAVLQEAQSEMLEWKDSGMSVMEMSHRSSDYIDIANKATTRFNRFIKNPKRLSSFISSRRRNSSILYDSNEFWIREVC